ncbi:hypothetical protein [Candidatus Nitrospira bockiana]
MLLAAESDAQARVEQKARRTQELIQKWLQGGGSPAKIGPLMEQFDKHMRAGRISDGEGILDQVLAIVDTQPTGGASLPAVPPAGGEPIPGGPFISPAVPVRLGKIPPGAEIVFHQNGFIYSMDRTGGNLTQITFDKPEYSWEHVAVSPDWRFIVGNEPVPKSTGGRPGSYCRAWLFDLEKGTKAQLLPNWIQVGNGGVDWDQQGFIYFAGKEKFLFANPKGPLEMLAEAAAHDVFKIKYDGTGLTRILKTTDRAEADVSVSEDGTLVAAVAFLTTPDDRRDLSEIWVVNSDGTNPRLVFKGGKTGVSSVHDPEITPDNTRVIFSMVNSSVPANYRHHADANTAHDIWSVKLNGTGLMRLTKPGPISIIPDWHKGAVVYFEASEKDNYMGISVVASDAPDQTPKRIKAGGNSAKWIPDKR